MVRLRSFILAAVRTLAPLQPGEPEKKKMRASAAKCVQKTLDIFSTEALIAKYQFLQWFLMLRSPNISFYNENDASRRKNA